MDVVRKSILTYTLRGCTGDDVAIDPDAGADCKVLQRRHIRSRLEYG